MEGERGDPLGEQDGDEERRERGRGCKRTDQVR